MPRTATKKRKASLEPQEEETPQKKSKAEQLAEGRARAKEWAEERARQKKLKAAAAAQGEEESPSSPWARDSRGRLLKTGQDDEEETTPVQKKTPVKKAKSTKKKASTPVKRTGTPIKKAATTTTTSASASAARRPATRTTPAGAVAASSSSARSSSRRNGTGATAEEENPPATKSSTTVSANAVLATAATAVADAKAAATPPLRKKQTSRKRAPKSNGQTLARTSGAGYGAPVPSTTTGSSSNALQGVDPAIQAALQRAHQAVTSKLIMEQTHSPASQTTTAAAQFRQSMQLHSSPVGENRNQRESDFNANRRKEQAKLVAAEAEAASSYPEPPPKSRLQRIWSKVTHVTEKTWEFVVYGLTALIGFVLAIAAVYWLIESTSGLWWGLSSSKGGTSTTVMVAPPPCFSNSKGVPTTQAEYEMALQYLEEKDHPYMPHWWTGMDQVPQELQDQGVEKCVRVENDKYKPCPAHGRCAGGFLRDCRATVVREEGEDPDGRSLYEVSTDTWDSCVVTAETQKDMDAMLQELTDWTACHTCGSCFYPSDKMKVEQGGVPLFEASAFSHPEDYLEALADASPKIRSQVRRTPKSGEIIQRTYFGLSHADKVPLSFSCWIWLLLKNVLGAVWTALMGTFQAYPLPSLGGILAVVVVWWMGRVRRKRQALKELVHEVRDMAYDRLVEESYPVLFLRDEVAIDLYPTSLKQRKYMNDVVWPRVMALVRCDNRIQTSHSKRGQKMLEHWEWISPKPRKTPSRSSRGPDQ